MYRRLPSITPEDIARFSKGQKSNIFISQLIENFRNYLFDMLDLISIFKLNPSHWCVLLCVCVVKLCVLFNSSCGYRAVELGNTQQQFHHEVAWEHVTVMFASWQWNMNMVVRLSVTNPEWQLEEEAEQWRWAPARDGDEPSWCLKLYNHGEGLLLVESGYYCFHIWESIKTLYYLKQALTHS